MVSPACCMVTLWNTAKASISRLAASTAPWVSVSGISHKKRLRLRRAKRSVARAILDQDPSGKHIEIEAVYKGLMRKHLWISKHYAMYALSSATEGTLRGDIIWTLTESQGVPCLSLHHLSQAGQSNVKVEAESSQAPTDLPNN